MPLPVQVSGVKCRSVSVIDFVTAPLSLPLSKLRALQPVSWITYESGRL